ncbi:MAG: DUF58 domain-containing protein [Halioglobus sp.]
MSALENENVYTSVAALTRLRHSGAAFNYLPHQRVGSLLSGRRHSRLRGRGLDFDELRNYRPGDDVRNMDWRVTNRTGRPHVRVYNEERDRPVLTIVDQRMPMFFGSQLNMKSVVAAEVAALTAWRVLAVGDRIGALLFNDSQSIEVKPTRSERRVVGWLGDLAKMNNALSAKNLEPANASALDAALQKVEHSIGHDHLVILVSDLFGFSNATTNSIKRIRAHNDFICIQVCDPLERDISNADSLVVSDGERQLQLSPAKQGLGKKFAASYDTSMTQMQKKMRHNEIPLLTVNTTEPVPGQLQQLLSGAKRSL